MRTVHNLRDHVIAFARALREAGIPVGPGNIVDALEVIETIDLHHAQYVQQTLQLIFAKHPREIEIFNRVFNEYWLVRPGDDWTPTPDKVHHPSTQKKPQNSRTTFLQVLQPNKDQMVSDEEEITVAAYSPFRVLVRKDFAHLDTAESEEIQALVRWMARSLAVRFSRRMRMTHQRQHFDFRKTLRHNLRRGGEIVDLQFKARLPHRLKLVVLCDVSKSMDLYSHFLIQFLHAFSTVYHRTELFVFSTRIHRVTDKLARRDLTAGIQAVLRDFQEWSGGTRIGESLQQFVSYYHPLLDSRTVVLILSDGWDTGQPELLAESMEAIHRKSGFVLWLNPLMGFSDYRPETRGMQAALPYIDLLAPVHNLSSLRQLVDYLIQIAGGRTLPRKKPLYHTYGS